MPDFSLESKNSSDQVVHQVHQVTANLVTYQESMICLVIIENIVICYNRETDQGSGA